MDEINRRVVDFFAQTGKSKTEFATGLGVSPSIMSHVSSGRNKVGLELIQNILTAYPEVSAQWLLTGRGKMFTEDNQQSLGQLKEDYVVLAKELNGISGQLEVYKRKFDQLKKYFD